MSIRLLGLDLDGTLLDPGGQLQASVRDAVDRVRARGIEVVICTGRRFRTALPIAQELGLSGPIVISNGGLVKEISSAETRHQTCLETSMAPHTRSARVMTATDSLTLQMMSAGLSESHRPTEQP